MQVSKGKDNPLLTNKELMSEVRQDIRTLHERLAEMSTEMQVTLKAVRQYNNLRQQLNDCMHRILSIEEQQAANRRTGRGIREWGGWGLSLVLGLITIYLFLSRGVM